MVVMQRGGMPQLTHFVVGWILLGNQHTLQEAGLNQNTVEARRYGNFSSRQQPCKQQLLSFWGKLQTKDLQRISLYGRGVAKIAATQMAGTYDMLTLSKCPVVKMKCPARATQGSGLHTTLLHWQQHNGPMSDLVHGGATK